MEKDRLFSHVGLLNEYVSRHLAIKYDALARVAVLEVLSEEALRQRGAELVREGSRLAEMLFDAEDDETLSPVEVEYQDDEETYRTRNIKLPTGEVHISHNAYRVKSDNSVQNSYTVWANVPRDSALEDSTVLDEDYSYYGHAARIAEIRDWSKTESSRTSGVAALQDSVETLQAIAETAGLEVKS